MGIKGLTKLLHDSCPEVLKENEVKHHFGRKVAIDTSMFLYSFLIAIRPDSHYNLTDANGEVTSHLQGLFNRTIRLLEAGVKPIYVFDGKPPTLKGGELAKRHKAKAKAKEELAVAKEQGDDDAAARLVKRTVTVSPKQNAECKRLLRLMGLPVVEAPCEAEAQCAELVRAGVAFATATEDMDALTLGTPVLLRRMTFSAAQKQPVLEIHLDKVLAGLSLTMDQFIDVCILCGCDYTDTIRGIGPKRALEFIRKYGSMEKLLENIDRKRYPVPDSFNYEGARLLFKEAEVASAATCDVQWNDVNEEGLRAFLVDEKNFNVDRVQRGIEKLKKCKSARVQGRLTNFFTVLPNSSASSSAAASSSSSSTPKRARGAAAKKSQGSATKRRRNC
jgi:flap endonuclease-1